MKIFLEGEFGKLNPDQERYMGIMLSSTEKLLRLISNILDSAKLEAGKPMMLNRTKWNALNAVRQIMEMHEGIVKAQNIRLYGYVNAWDGHPRRKAIQKADPVILHADGELLERVLHNLLENALKFTPVGGEIEITLNDDPEKLEFFVRDTGKGMSEEILKTIFHKFQQAPGTKGGAGLGLTISKHIVEAHGGKIEVESQIDEGSTFRFWIPKRTANQ